MDHDESPADEQEPWGPEYRDAERDALAVAAGCVRGDWDALATLHDFNFPGMLTAAFNMFFAVCAENGQDPAEWIAKRQAQWNAAEAAEGDG